MHVFRGALPELSVNRSLSVNQSSPYYIVSYFAILRAGCVAVPINVFLTPNEVSYILNDSGCRMLIYSIGFLPHVKEIGSSVKDMKAVTFGDIPRERAEVYKGSGDEIAVFLYTSGTTGFPKGAMLTHNNLITNAKACRDVMHVRHKDRVLLFLPLFHAFSFTVCVLLPICTGATIVLLTSVKPFSKVIKSIFRERISFFVAVPTVYNILSRKKVPFLVRFLLKFLLNIRACISGASALPADTITAFEKRFRLPLIEGYGLTEASPVVSVNPLKGLRKHSSVGLPVPGVEASVIGGDGEDLPSGEVGELIIRGPNIMKGYFNKEAETEEVLKDGWLHTGDMAKIDGDGYIYIVDRKKDLIIVDGMNVYPREVEDLINRHPLIEESAMVGVPDGKGSELTMLFIKKKEDSVVDEDEIRDFMRGNLARYKVPRRMVFIDEFPKTATGKIRKVDLKKWKT
jgi:long-chain acyl-CoA synthetase